MIACVLESPLAITATSSEKDQFFNVNDFKAVTFLFLFIVSFLFNIGLFIINLYKTLKVTTEQKHFFYQASISTHREDVEKDLKMQIGKKITLPVQSTANSSLSSTPTATPTVSSTTNTSLQQQQSKKDR